MADKGRRREGSKAKLRRYLLANIGRVLSSDELYEASGGAVEYSRRLRELRNQEGWPIRTHNDLDHLSPGQYILEEEPPSKGTHRFASTFSTRLRAQVLERNGYTCQMCGLGAGEPDHNRGGARTILHVGHIKDKQHGGTDHPGNLRSLCMTCNLGARDLTQEPPSSSWVLQQLRRAKIDDQRAALVWLQKKFRN